MAERVHSLAFMAPDDQRGAMYAFIASFMRLGESVLDVGCGNGSFVAFAAAKGMRASGIDHDPCNVSDAVGRGLNVTQGDAFTIEGPENLDVVTMIHLIEHFPPNEAQALVAAYARRLRSGGRIIIMTPNFADWTVASNIFWLDPTHVRPYPAMLLHQMLEGEGLVVVHTSRKRLVRFGLKQNLLRPLGRLRFGKDFERMNLTVVAERQHA